MILSDNTYRFAKFVAQIGLPALGALYFALAAIWSLPAPEKIIGTIVAVDTFMGVVLGISTKSYLKSDSSYAGTINVTDAPDKTLFSLDLNQHPEELRNKDHVRFKVSASSQKKVG